MKTNKAIRRWMKERGLSQRDIARLAGISESMVSRLLRDERSIGHKTALRINKVTDIPLLELFK